MKFGALAILRMNLNLVQCHPVLQPAFYCNMGSRVLFLA